MNSRLPATVTVLALAAIVAFAQAGQAVGWRTDGTGRYPDADAPVKWSPEGPFVWKSAMPTWSNACPVIVGDKIFICAEPDTLICVSRTDGKILWQRANPLEELLSDQQKSDMAAAAGKIAEIKKELNPLSRRQRRIRNLMKRPRDDAELADLKKQEKDLDKQIKKVQSKMDPLLEDIRPLAEKTNGYTSPTPITDGKSVYVLFGTGVAARYDMDGNRKWIKLVQKPIHKWGHSSSPLLVGDKLIIHVRDIFGLDAATGEQLWRAKSQPHWGSILHARIGDVDVAVSSHGDIVRVSDGKVLAAAIQPLDYNSPVIKDGVVYFIQHGGKAIKLPDKTSDKIDPKVLWKTDPPDDRYYGSPLVHDGLIYVVHRKNVFSVIDAETGKVVYSKKLDLGKGTTYPSITLGGKYIYVSIDNGTTLVLEPGRTYKEIARNKLEKFRTSPVFDGKFVYIRGLKHLYCIGKQPADSTLAATEN